MAKTYSDIIETTVNVTKAELLALLGQKAQDAGYINFVPDTVEVDRTAFDDGQGEEEGWALTFSAGRP